MKCYTMYLGILQSDGQDISAVKHISYAIYFPISVSFHHVYIQCLSDKGVRNDRLTGHHSPAVNGEGAVCSAVVVI